MAWSVSSKPTLKCVPSSSVERPRDPQRPVDHIRPCKGTDATCEEERGGVTPGGGGVGDHPPVAPASLSLTGAHLLFGFPTMRPRGTSPLQAPAPLPHFPASRTMSQNKPLFFTVTQARLFRYGRKQMGTPGHAAEPLARSHRLDTPSSPRSALAPAQSPRWLPCAARAV